MTDFGNVTPVLDQRQDDLYQSTDGLYREPILIDAAAVDTANVGNETHLRRGLVMARDVNTGKVLELDNATLADRPVAEVLILDQDIELDGTNDQAATVVRAGYLRRQRLIFKDAAAEAAFDAAVLDVQRLQFR